MEKQFCRRKTYISAGILPVEVHAIEAVLRHEAQEIRNERPPVRLGRDHGWEDTLPGSWIAESPATQGAYNFEVGVAFFQIGNGAVQLCRQAIHIGDLEIRCDVAKGKVEMCEHFDGNLAWLHSSASMLSVPAFVVGDDLLLYV